MGQNIPTFINLNVFYALHPELRFDEDFQAYLSEINVGSEGVEIADLHRSYNAAEILDQSEIEHLLADTTSVLPAKLVLWNYAATFVDGHLLKDVVQAVYFAHTEPTGNLFEDLNHEITTVLSKAEESPIYTSPDRSEHVVQVLRQPSSQVRLLQLNLGFENFGKKECALIYRYYAATMGLTPEQVYLEFVRVAFDGQMPSTSNFYVDNTLESDSQVRSRRDFNSLQAALVKASSNHLLGAITSTPVKYPDWMDDVDPIKIDSLIAGPLLSIYKSLYKRYGSGEGIPKYEKILKEAGCSKNFIDNLLYLEKTKSDNVIATRLEMFFLKNGYKVFNLGDFQFNAEKNRQSHPPLLLLGKVARFHEYTGLATPTEHFGAYDMVPLQAQSSAFVPAATVSNVDLDQNFAAALQYLDFDDDVLAPLRQTPDGQRLIKAAFGNRPRLNRDVLIQFSYNLQEANFILNTTEGKIGSRDYQTQLCRAFILALRQSPEPEKLLIYFYALSFAWTDLKSFLTPLFQYINVPKSNSSTTGADGEIIIEDTLPALSVFAIDDDYGSERMQEVLARLFEIPASPDFPSPQRDEILAACDALLDEDAILKAADLYFHIQDVPVASGQRQRRQAPIAKASLETVPLSWFEQAATLLELDAADFTAASRRKDGLLTWDELANISWTSENREIFGFAAKRHRLALSRVLRDLDQKVSPDFYPVSEFTKHQIGILLRESKDPKLANAVAEKVPRRVLRLANAELDWSYQSTVQQLEARFPLASRLYYAKVHDQTLLTLNKLVRIFSSRNDEAKQWRQAHEIVGALAATEQGIPPEVTLFLADRMSEKPPQPTVVENFFSGLPVTFCELINFFAFGANVSVATCLEIVKNQVLFGQVLENFLIMPSAKPAWLDNFMTALWQVSAEERELGNSKKTLRAFLTALAPGLDKDWVQEVFLNCAEQFKGSDSGFLTDFVILFFSENLESHFKLYRFFWQNAESLLVSRSMILKSIFSEIRNQFSKSWAQDSHLQVAIYKDLLLSFFQNRTDTEVNALLCEMDEVEVTLFVVALLLKTDPTRDGSVYKDLWLNKINIIISERHLLLLFKMIDLIGEQDVESLCEDLGLDSAETKKTKEKCHVLFISLPYLEKAFARANIYFQQMNQDEEGELGKHLVAADDLPEHLSQAAYLAKMFFKDLQPAIVIAKNPQMPEAEREKKTLLLNKIDDWISRTPSPYVKMILLFYRHELDQNTDIKLANDIKNRFERQDPELPAYDRLVYEHITDNSDFSVELQPFGKEIPAQVDMNRAEVLFFDVAPPENGNHGDMIHAVYDAHGVTSYGGVVASGPDLVSQVYNTLSGLDFSELSAQVVSFSIGDARSKDFSSRAARKFLASEQAQQLQSLLAELDKQGIVVVASAGNSGKTRRSSHKNQLSMLSFFSPPLCLVTATDDEKAIAGYSSRGSMRVRPTLTGNAKWQGTSFSGPDIGARIAKINAEIGVKPAHPLTGTQKSLCLMLAAQPLMSNNPMEQGAGVPEEDIALWLAYRFSGDHNEQDLLQRAAELGIADNWDWLNFIVEKYERDFRNQPRRLWEDLLKS